MKTARLTAGCILFLIVVLGIMSFAFRSREPVYQGKKLSQWLPELDTGRWPRDGHFIPADEAIRQMGV